MQFSRPLKLFCKKCNKLAFQVAITRIIRLEKINVDIRNGMLTTRLEIYLPRIHNVRVNCVWTLEIHTITITIRNV